MNYADSQLGVLVTSGYDLRDGVYIDVRDLNSSESQEILRVERERATERNQIIMNN